MLKKRKKKTKKQKPITEIPVIRPNVAGIDLGSISHFVAGPVRPDQTNVEEFGTTTPQLNALADWLEEQGVESVAMESTGVYWNPIYEILESRGFEVLLVNARHLGNVPGRKTDVIDCQWIQILHSCGLLKGSFRPDDAICALRALKRQCANLVHERTRAVQWMQKAMDQMNIKVHHAVTDITGTTGMSIIRAIVSGERDPIKLAAYRDKRCKKSHEEIAECLTGNWRDEHLFNLEMALRHYDHLESMIETYNAQLLAGIERLQPPVSKNESVPAHPNPVKEKAIQKRNDQVMREALWRLSGVDLCRIDGISAECALIVLTEVGPDLSTFDNEKKFAAWLRLSPRYGVSGGKPLSKKKKAAMGSTRVATVLRMGAMSLQKSKTALGAYFRRISRHKGFSVAVFATARKLSALIYRMLRYGVDYVDIGEREYEMQFAKRRLEGLKSSAKAMGYTLIPNEVAA
jgi:transposase